MKTVRKETRSCSRSNSGITNINKGERPNDIRTNSGMGFFESMTMFK